LYAVVVNVICRTSTVVVFATSLYDITALGGLLCADVPLRNHTLT